MLKILIVEDETIISMHLKILAESLGHEVVGQVSDLDACLRQVLDKNPDLLLMDISIEGPDDGIMAAHIIQEEFFKPIIFVTGYSSQDVRQRAAQLKQAVYLTKPIAKEQLFKAIEDMELRKPALVQEPAAPETIEMHKRVARLYNRLYIYTRETMFHTFRVKFWAMRLAEEIGLDHWMKNDLSMAAILHDIGKIYVPKEILEKPGRLTEEEFEAIKKHPEDAVKIMEKFDGFKGVAAIVCSHHERWDGTGYPKGIKGEEIPLTSRIIALADAFDVMTHARAYKKGMKLKAALEEIHSCQGTQFDPGLVAPFERCVEKHTF